MKNSNQEKTVILFAHCAVKEAVIKESISALKTEFVKQIANCLFLYVKPDLEPITENDKKNKLCGNWGGESVVDYVCQLIDCGFDKVFVLASIPVYMELKKHDFQVDNLILDYVQRFITDEIKEKLRKFFVGIN